MDEERLLLEAEHALDLLIRAAHQYGRASMEHRGTNCFCVATYLRGDLHAVPCRDLTEALRRGRVAVRALKKERRRGPYTVITGPVIPGPGTIAAEGVPG
jgi:hypothetical protein